MIMKIEFLVSGCRINNIKDLKLREKNIDNAVIVNQFSKKEKVDKIDRKSVV